MTSRFEFCSREANGRVILSEAKNLGWESEGDGAAKILRFAQNDIQELGKLFRERS